MFIFAAIIITILGAAIGSFLNVLIDRLPSGREIFIDRSVCDSCHKQLKVQDLIPIFSYLALKGKCRFCHAKIPIRILIVEITIAAAFLVSFYCFYTSVDPLSVIVYFLAIFCLFTVIFFADIDYGIIPDQTILASSTIILIYTVFFQKPHLASHLLAGAGAAIFFLFLYLVTKGKGMGFGDVKLSFVLGFLLGYPKVIPAIYLAFLTGAVVAIILVVWGKKKIQGGTIPFGPFLVLSTVFSFLWGDQLIQKTLQVLLH